LAFDISQLTECCRDEDRYGGPIRWGGLAWDKYPDAVHLSQLLRIGDDRRGERPGKRGQQEAAAVHHSMT
jgi:hypothetical protein